MYNEADTLHIKLGDLRLEKRLEKIVKDLVEQPSVSIPKACNSQAATKATYRFFSNDTVEAKSIRNGYRKSTIERIIEQGENATILFPSDATNIVYTSHKKLKGIGVLRNQNARGLNLHTTLAVTENEIVLGSIDQHCWGRKPEDYGRRRLKIERPIEEKETYRWLESFRAAQSALPDNARGIYLGDRGADIYEIFLEERKENMHLLIRVSRNRPLTNSPEKLFQELENTPSAGITEVIIKRSGERKERAAKLEIRYKKVTIKPPNRKNKLSSVCMTIISAKEIIGNSEVEDPVHWMLLTTLPIDSLEGAIYAVQTYAKRWIIERYHYVLKEGCKVEELQFEEANRIDKAIAVYTIVACRIMQITYLARAFPDLPCTKVFDDDEWRALYCYANKTSKEPSSPMSISEAVMMLAKLGGFQGRKRDGHPGVQVIWYGMSKLEGAVEMYRILKKKKRCG